MRLQKVQDALNKKNIKFEYTEEAVSYTHLTLPTTPYV